MDDKVQDLADWLMDQYESTYPEADLRTLYRALCKVMDLKIIDFEDDGQPDDYQEHSDFAQDGYFENQECNEDGFWS